MADDSDDEYVCEACGERFESEEALEKHVHEVGLTE
jgi:DNA-directed RNA polymerase subunit RPC12/RpoP